MNELLMLALAGVAGMALGAIFFGGLCWTVRKAVSSPRPALWLLGSGLLRMSIALAGFYFVGQGHWARILACVLGFFAARFVVTRLTRPQAASTESSPDESSIRHAQEARHAP